MEESVAVLACVTVWAILFYPFFQGPGRFVEAIKLSLKPDVISLFMGGWREEMREEARFWIFICIGVASGVAVYRMLGGVPWFEQ